jgi:hypothetical protein
MRKFKFRHKFRELFEITIGVYGNEKDAWRHLEDEGFNTSNFVLVIN